MSRWQQAHDAFMSEGWNRISEYSTNIDLRQFSNRELRREVARFKKLTTFLTKHFEALDVDLVPVPLWNDMQYLASDCSNHLSPDIQNMSRANDYLDEIVKIVRPYMASEKGSAQAAAAAFRKYNQTIEETLNSMSTVCDDAVEATETAKREVEANKLAVANYVVELLGVDDGEPRDRQSIKSKVQLLWDSFNEQATKVEDFYNRLIRGGFGEDENDHGIIKEVERIKGDALVADHAIKSTEAHIEELKGFYEDVFGQTDEDGETVGGLKQEIADRTTKFDALEERIETLLPGATSAGLAAAYKDLKDVSANKESAYRWCFIGIVGLFGMVMFVWILMTSAELDVTQWIISLLYKLPIILPVIWLALFFSKRRSENHRLEQEYAHKEALAKSYDSYKTQITALQDKDEKLLITLLTVAINAIGKNPAETLDKSHGDRTPAEEVTETVVSAVKKGVNNGS